MQTENRKPVIGRLEKIDLPDLSIRNLDAKIDTGAYTSSLHCHNIELFQNNSMPWVSFHVLDPKHPEYEEIEFRSPVHRIKSIKSSNGSSEERVIIVQQVFFNGERGRIQLSLTDRSEMKYPVLIGRRFIKNRFVVDVSKKYLSKPIK